MTRDVTLTRRFVLVALNLRSTPGDCDVGLRSGGDGRLLRPPWPGHPLRKTSESARRY